MLYKILYVYLMLAIYNICLIFHWLFIVFTILGIYSAIPNLLSKQLPAYLATLSNFDCALSTLHYHLADFEKWSYFLIF